MKFRFCGDLHCPDWILAEIASLAKLTSIKFKLLCSLIVKNLLADQKSADQQQTSGNEERNANLLKEAARIANSTENELKGMVAALEFILSASARYSVQSELLSNEMQQLGLPREHAAALSKVYSESLAELRVSLEGRVFTVGSQLIRVEPPQIEYEVATGSLLGRDERITSLTLQLANADGKGTQALNMRVTREQARLLRSELLDALATVEQFSEPTQAAAK